MKSKIKRRIVMKKELNNDCIKFLTVNGLRTPKYVWIGEDIFGNKIHDTTKSGLKDKIERNNRVFTKYPELLNI